MLSLFNRASIGSYYTSLELYGIPPLFIYRIYRVKITV